MNNVIGDATTLKLENEKLKQRMTQVESMNENCLKDLLN